MTQVSDNVDPTPMVSPSSGSYGSEVPPRGPLQDMFASIDTIAGGSAKDRTASPDSFTGGTGGRGIGGMAEPPSPIADSSGGPAQDVP